jgi:putative transposase
MSATTVAPASQAPLNESALRLHLGRLGLGPAAEAELLEMALSSPARKIGGGLHNYTVRFHSRKNGALRLLESHTVERLFALELELDPNVLAYHCQVACRGISRRGGQHVTKGTVDFLVWYRDALELVECKARAKLLKLLETKPDEWVEHEGQVLRPPYLEWAQQRRVSYRVWTPSQFFGIHLANLQLMYAVSKQYVPGSLLEPMSKAIAIVRSGPTTIDDLCRKVPRLTPEWVALLLAEQRVFGPLRYVPIDHIEDFLLFSHREQAAELDLMYEARRVGALSQTSDAICSAPYTDVICAEKRLARVDAYIALGRVPNSYWRGLRNLVVAAREAGENPLGALMTRLRDCGNRGSHLLTPQEDAIKHVLKEFWDKGISQDRPELYSELKTACADRNVPTPSRSTLNKRISSRDSVRRTMNTGGVRQYQATRPASDPRERSIDAIARHLVLVIDSTKCDNRTMPDLADKLLFDTPVLYAGVDACTVEPMAHAFVFGPARRDGLALLVRDYVRRHGRLPHAILHDGGSENTSLWFDAFADRYGVDLIKTPTAFSRGKGQIENALGRANSQLSHRLAGSTAPDQAGRNVDGKFKSYKTARHQFRTIRGEMETVLHQDFVYTPMGDDISPEERRQQSIDSFPNVGIPIVLDDEFLHLTSIPVRAKTFDPTRGIRTQGQTYFSQELLDAMRNSQILDVRYDPADSTLLWVKTTKGLLKAWSKKATATSHCDADQREFHSLFSAELRGEARERREVIRDARYRRIATANANALATNTSDSDVEQPHEREDASDNATRSKIVFSLDMINILDEKPV